MTNGCLDGPVTESIIGVPFRPVWGIDWYFATGSVTFPDFVIPPASFGENQERENKEERKIQLSRNLLESLDLMFRFNFVTSLLTNGTSLNFIPFFAMCSS